MGIAVNIDSVGTQQFNIVGAEKITHTQPTYYNPISTRIQDLDEDNVEQASSATYTAAEAAEHNAKLEGALKAGVALTAEQATAYNTAVIGASKEADDTLTEEEANAYNALLTGAVKEGDEKPAETPAEPAQP